MALPPSKQAIQDSFHGASTRRTYTTYQKQFQEFCDSTKDGLLPELASTEDCTDFFHHLYSLGRKARTVDLAKTSLVAFFNVKGVTPNPAKDVAARRYVVGLQKFNKLNNVDEEKKAHPLTVHELSTIMNSFASYHTFLAAMYRFMLCTCFLGCFRISEVLSLRWNDVALRDDDNGKFVYVRLRWHKKASVEKDSQIYHLVDECSYPCLRVCGMFEDYLAKVRQACINFSQDAFVFPNVMMLQTGIPKIDWFKHIEQNHVRKCLQDIVEASPALPIGISLHSMRRGGSFYRVFESPERKFNFRELMAWCRWSDAKTCCEYLVTRSISDEIDPRNLLRVGKALNSAVFDANSSMPLTLDKIIEAITKCIQDNTNSNRPEPPAKRQKTMIEFVSFKSIPTARCGREAWDQWFTANPANGCLRALKDFTKDMIRIDRKKYSERQTLAAAFSKYQTYAQFEAAYVIN